MNREQPIGTFQRGLKLLKAKKLNSELMGWKLSFPHIRVGNIQIPEARMAEHFLVTGAPGTGKSTLIRQMLQQIQARGETAIVVDPVSEFVQEFYDEKRGDWLLNPLDERSPSWSPRLEADSTSDLAGVAGTLIRRSDSWHDEARILLTGALAAVETAQQLLELLRLPYGDIVEKLKETAASAICDPRAVNQFSAIRGIAVTAIESFQYIRNQAPRHWSAQEWDKKRQGWIFLASTEGTRAAVQGVQGIWLDLLVRQLLNRPIGDESTWVITDEVATLGYQPRLKDLLTRGRKQGICGVLGFQNIAQLREIYGQNGAIELLSAPFTQIFLRTTEPETAEWASRAIGEQELAHKERIYTSRLAPTSKIQGLGTRQGYIIVGSRRATIDIPARWLEKKQPAFLPRTLEPLPIPAPVWIEDPLEYQRWRDMVSRCHDPRNFNYRWYGAKGVEVCEEWRGSEKELYDRVKYQHFATYLIDTIGPCPSPNHSLGRIIETDPDPKKNGYRPGNICWQTRKEQERTRWLRKKTKTTATRPDSIGQ